MKAPIFVRQVTPPEILQLQQGLHSSQAFTLRRAQIILASARGQRPSLIATQLGCAVQTVRNVIKAFNEEGPACLLEKSSRPKTVLPIFDEVKCEQLRHILHQSPRTYGLPTSLWTLAQVAQVCYQTGVTEQLVSTETIRSALARRSVNWQRAKHWISSPDPQYLRKKAPRPPDRISPYPRLAGGLPGRVLVEQAGAAQFA